MLHDFEPGAYRFLEGGFPYSAGVIAKPGFAIRRVRLARPLPVAAGLLVVLTAVGMVRSGIVPFEFFPNLDGKTIIGQVVYPDGTPVAVTSEATRRPVSAAAHRARSIRSCCPARRESARSRCRTRTDHPRELSRR